jgi:hypothetical protein
LQAQKFRRFIKKMSTDIRDHAAVVEPAVRVGPMNAGGKTFAKELRAILLTKRHKIRTIGQPQAILLPGECRSVSGAARTPMKPRL